MAKYKKSEAKEWAKEKFRGIENVLMRSFKEMNTNPLIGFLRTILLFATSRVKFF